MLTAYVIPACLESTFCWKSQRQATGGREKQDDADQSGDARQDEVDGVKGRGSNEGTTAKGSGRQLTAWAGHVQGISNETFANVAFKYGVDSTVGR